MLLKRSLTLVCERCCTNKAYLLTYADWARGTEATVAIQWNCREIPTLVTSSFIETVHLTVLFTNVCWRVLECLFQPLTSLCMKEDGGGAGSSAVSSQSAACLEQGSQRKFELYPYIQYGSNSISHLKIYQYIFYIYCPALLSTWLFKQWEATHCIN